ncbi:hypothetical protein II810_00045 [bacterium]|nr:hypothetical protein [bacterium]
MMRGVILTLIMLIGMQGICAENYLNAVVISETDGNPSVTLRTDIPVNIKRETKSQNSLVLTLPNTKQATNISTIYKNTSDVNGLLVQNEGKNVKIYIDASDISNSDVVLETPGTAPIVFNNTNSNKKLIWSLISVFLLLITSIYNKFKKPVNKALDINEVIKEREKKLYKDFQKEISTLPTLNYKLKSYSKHVLKGETIRSYASRMPNAL